MKYVLIFLQVGAVIALILHLFGYLTNNIIPVVSYAIILAGLLFIIRNRRKAA